MAIVKESVLTSPTTQSFPLGEQIMSKHLRMKPGQYPLDTYFDVSCETHEDKKAILRLSGNLNLEYKENAGLSKG